MISSSSDKMKITHRSMSAIAKKNIDHVSSSCSGSSANTQTDAINGYDVLLGRGGLTNSHIGNKHFRCVVAEHQPEYLIARKNEKKEIAKRIVDCIHARGGRFLKRTADSEVWSEVTTKKALEKTSQSLRESLDVRHKKFRPDKVFQRQDEDNTNPRKRARLVKGLVMGSPNLTGMNASCNTRRAVDDIPELSSEDGMGSGHSKFEPFFHFYQSAADPADSLAEDCGNILEI
ncbi:hypothetical protein IV203_008389 [Nitzschia inconspicua]|uniref:DUF6824 domain-containing protein n=1 Tax=Nitzschia inconspicua TaxID=303405 RepID=A0A9K3KZ51_9STRA|nr:hypothetical protein IV203_008389 [Nitzschia inconspicua]